MRLIERIKSFLQTKDKAEMEGFAETLRKKFHIEDFLYATTEGLPIMGTFENYELLSAKLPEILKVLSDLEYSESYVITNGAGTVYTIIKITDDVIMLGKGTKPLNPNEISHIITISRTELGI